MINEDQFQDMDFQNQIYVDQLRDQFVKEHINIDHVEKGDYLPLQAQVEIKELENAFNFVEMKKQITKENLQKERKMFGIAT